MCLPGKYGKDQNYRTWSKDKSISFKIRSKWNSLIGIFLRNIGQVLKQGNSILQKSTLLRWTSSDATELRNQTLVRPYPQFQSRKLSQLWLVPHIEPPLHREPEICEKSNFQFSLRVSTEWEAFYLDERDSHELQQFLALLIVFWCHFHQSFRELLHIFLIVCFLGFLQLLLSFFASLLALRELKKEN